MGRSFFADRASKIPRSLVPSLPVFVLAKMKCLGTFKAMDNIRLSPYESALVFRA